jgi:hypothetical protein
MAGLISPLLGWGNAYSRKVPLAIIDGVVLTCEWMVGETIGPVVDVNELLQALMSITRRSKIGKFVKRFISMRLDIGSWLATNLFL